MRLTEVFRQFVALIVTVGAPLAAKVVDAILASMGSPKPGTERRFKSTTFVDRPVDLGKLAGSLSDALRSEGLNADGRDLHKAIVDECSKRGDLWARQCLADALNEHLVKPLQGVAGAFGHAPDAAPAKADKPPKKARG